MPTIRCGHCRGTHTSVADVRACSIDRPSPAAPATNLTNTETAVIGAGPDSLGRTLVVRHDDEPPEPWHDAPTFSIDAAAPPDLDVLAAMSDRWHRRARYVVRLAGDWGTGEVRTDEPWGLSPSFELAGERFAHLVWSNAVELVDGQLRSRPAAMAVGAGASLGGDRDIVLADGTTAWIDGGPLDPGAAPGGHILHSLQVTGGVLRPLGTSRPQADLAADQLEAVGHRGGAARIIAPAGSGKTRVLTERARHLVREWGVPTEVVTLVAFNKRAQVEMHERLEDVAGLNIRTLNGLALAILNGTGGFGGPNGGAGLTTIDERDVRRLVERLVELPRRANTDPVAVWIEALAEVRLGLRDPAQVETDHGGDVDGFAQVFGRYRDLLAANRVVDFDEQIYRAIELLLADPQARATARRRCALLLVDEFQDLTPAHLLFVRLIAGPRGDVFGVGDDDQTIYGFTGATPRWLIDYEQFFPGATPHALEVNYRCAPAVVTAADTLIRVNRQRVSKTIVAEPGRADEPGELVARTTGDAAAEVIARVRAHIDHGADPASVVVLARVNVTLAVPQVALAAAKIPVVGAVDASLLHRTGIRSVMAWLRLGADADHIDPADIADTVRRPSRGMSRKVIEWMSEHRSTRDLERLARRLSDRDAAKIDAWLTDVGRVTRTQRDATTIEMIELIRDGIGLGRALDALDQSRGSADRSTHLDDIEMLRGLARLQPDPGSFEPWLGQVLGAETAALGEGVQLSTVHRVKGLEWPHVVVIGADQGTFPHRLADLEEERRVFHVAITRSSSTTTVIADAERPSRFLDEMAGRVPTVADEPQRLVRKPSRASAKKAAGPPTDQVVGGEDAFEALRAWRLERSRADKVAPFIIFHDAVLRAIAAAGPDDLAALARVKGVGATKLENYGDDILAVLAES